MRRGEQMAQRAELEPGLGILSPQAGFGGSYSFKGPKTGPGWQN
jgi:hypothetical protein